MYGVNCGATSGLCYSAASVMPTGMSGAGLARLLLQVAGAGFGLYTVTCLVLLATGLVLRHRRSRPVPPGPEPDEGTASGATALRRGASW
ncbi:hypothetical protein [Kitasatospora sp. NPDC002040]|uniref:hypothetical protein n=1 Tax=Kitasatospora sp. NPDC002040 TaxID=3154661 RepID=UPI003328E1BD